MNIAWPKKSTVIAVVGIFAVFALIGAVTGVNKITELVVESSTLQPVQLTDVDGTPLVASNGQPEIVYESSFSDRALEKLGQVGEFVLGVLGVALAWSFRIVQLFAGKIDEWLSGGSSPRGPTQEALGHITDAQWDSMLQMLSIAIAEGNAARIASICNMMNGYEFMGATQLLEFNQTEEASDAEA